MAAAEERGKQVPEEIKKRGDEGGSRSPRWVPRRHATKWLATRGPERGEGYYVSTWLPLLSIKGGEGEMQQKFQGCAQDVVLRRTEDRSYTSDGTNS